MSFHLPVVLPGTSISLEMVPREIRFHASNLLPTLRFSENCLFFPWRYLGLGASISFRDAAKRNSLPASNLLLTILRDFFLASHSNLQRHN